jgi:hypothetical protein
MDLGRFGIYFGYAMAALFCCLGIVVLCGGLPGLLEIPSSPLRTLTGIVLLMYAVFRYIITRTKAKQTNGERPAL